MGVRVALTLRPVDIEGPGRWRWLLLDDAGNPMADHEVHLDVSSAEYRAFCDLYGYVERNRVLDDRVGSETAIVDRVGRWIGERVFGTPIGHELTGTVRVEVPAEAEFLVARPLEIAHVDGVPLARRGVTLVFDLPPDAGRSKEPVGEVLRILALFSLPVGGSVLNLRRERFQLAATVRRIAAQSGKAIELRVLQYGVTRERLAEAAEEYPGWDVLHISGHGRRGVVLLERPDGSPDEVPTDTLVELLMPAADRLKVAVVAACNSGAEVAASTLRAMNLDQVAEQVEAEAAEGGAAGVDAPARVGLARGLVQRLGVAVVGMRFPVIDTFAIALTRELYPRLLGSEQPLDRAVALALPKAAGEVPTAGRPALSIGTPAVFGPAAGLRVAPPRGEVPLDPSLVRMTSFPDEPVRFVGRTPALTAAGQALAPESGKSAVLFVGMAGAGKTTCAVELAYQHRDRFAGGMLWWQAPSHDEFDQALPTFAHAVEQQLRLPLMQAIGSEAALRQFLPQLRATLRNKAILVVVDNAETLLSRTQTWRDPLWELLMATLVGHGGWSRLVVTSRHTPTGWDSHDQVVVRPTYALSLAESVLLARELPHLGRLLDDEPHPERSGAEVAEGLALARRALHVVQGHPKLLELADAAAGDDLDRLREHLDAAEAVEDRAAVGAFFTTGVSGLDGDQFLKVLHDWTVAAVAGLPDAARRLAGLVACVEDSDRHTMILEMVWPVLWRQRHGADTPVPDLVGTLAMLQAAAIVEIEPDPEPVGSAGPGGEEARPALVRMHPGVAEAVRAGAAAGFADLVDELCGELWTTIYQHAAEGEQRGEQVGGAIVRAGLAAAPYLIRRGDWHTAGMLLERAVQRDASPGVSRRVLGLLAQIVAGDPDPQHRLEYEGLYAAVLARVDPAAAQARLRQVVDQTRDSGHPAVAATVVIYLVTLLRARGDLAAALAVVDERAGLLTEAGAGPWPHAHNESMRLQVLAETGEHRRVLAEATALLARLDTLPSQPDPADRVEAWNVRENVGDTARSAASAVQDWAAALTFSRQVQESKRQRGASLHDRARIRFNDYFPLLQLGRVDEAEQVMLACQQVFEDAADIHALGMVYSARANLETRRGRLGEAIHWERVALRYKYQRPEPETLAVSHNNLAVYLGETGPAGRDILAHRLAAALLRRVTGRTATYTDTVHNLATDLQRHGRTALPADVDQLTTIVEEVAGVRFGDVFTALVPDPATRTALYSDTVDASAQVDLAALHLQAWGPVTAAVAAATHGDRQASTWLEPVLDQAANSPQWAGLAAVLRRILGGERDPAVLTTGLNEIDTAIVTAVLHAIENPPDPEARLEEWAPIIAAVAAAAHGDGRAGAELEPVLTELAGTEDWSALVETLRRIVGGERDPAALTNGLDEIDTSIVTAVLTTIQQANP
jgi:tetratricopeptide (TPR) repeat protein